MTAKAADGHFGRELAAGTPVTLAGAKELLRPGIVTVCVPLGAQVLAEIVSGVLVKFLGYGETFRMDSGNSVVLGRILILMALLCRYGAEIGSVDAG